MLSHHFDTPTIQALCLLASGTAPSPNIGSPFANTVGYTLSSYELQSSRELRKSRRPEARTSSTSGLLFGREFPAQIELLYGLFPQLTGTNNNTLSYARRENAPIDGFPRIPLFCGSLWPKAIRVPLKRKEQPAKGHP